MNYAKNLLILSVTHSLSEVLEQGCGQQLLKQVLDQANSSYEQVLAKLV